MRRVASTSRSDREAVGIRAVDAIAQVTPTSSFYRNLPLVSGTSIAPIRYTRKAPAKETESATGGFPRDPLSSETTAGIIPPMANPTFQDIAVPVARNDVGNRSFKKINSGA